jgi:hypothetical protein
MDDDGVFIFRHGHILCRFGGAYFLMLPQSFIGLIFLIAIFAFKGVIIYIFNGDIIFMFQVVGMFIGGTMDFIMLFGGVE